jgi:predicted esterase YcpF (UPF0227 family)
MDNLKILFVHGLESGPNGSKIKYLQKYFNVIAPDLKMSKFNITKENSLIRNLIRYVRIPLGISLLGVFLIWKYGGKLAGSITLVLILIIGLFYKKKIISNAVKNSLESSI